MRKTNGNFITEVYITEIETHWIGLILEWRLQKNQWTWGFTETVKSEHEPGLKINQYSLTGLWDKNKMSIICFFSLKKTGGKMWCWKIF